MKYFTLLLLALSIALTSCIDVNTNSASAQLEVTAFKSQDETTNKSATTTVEVRKDSKNSISLASWNIRDLGGSKDDKEIYQIAQVLRDFDVVAIQEVVAKDPKGAQAVAKIVDALNRMGSKWDYRVSDPTQSPSVYKSERYAFLWKTTKVNLVTRPYLDSKLATICDREPYIAHFKPKKEGDAFYVVNFHSRRFDAHPEEEIKHFIKYPERLQTKRVIIAGDFNLDEKHKVWDDFYKQGYKNALSETKTTLKLKCKYGMYKNHAIDNIYVTKDVEMTKTGSIDIVERCDQLDNARTLSDHLPVYIEFQ